MSNASDLVLIAIAVSALAGYLYFASGKQNSAVAYAVIAVIAAIGMSWSMPLAIEQVRFNAGYPLKEEEAINWISADIDRASVLWSWNNWPYSKDLRNPAREHNPVRVESLALRLIYVKAARFADVARRRKAEPPVDDLNQRIDPKKTSFFMSSSTFHDGRYPNSANCTGPYHGDIKKLVGLARVATTDVLATGIREVLRNYFEVCDDNTSQDSIMQRIGVSRASDVLESDLETPDLTIGLVLSSAWTIFIYLGIIAACLWLIIRDRESARTGFIDSP